jgi:hypothetical protein
MSKLVWDNAGERIYETGVDHGILFTKTAEGGGYAEGVAWNGLTGVTVSPSGAEASAIYADNIKYLNLYSTEEVGGTVEAYTYPDEFMVCDGSVELHNGVYLGQQPRKPFALCWRTKVGNDVEGTEHGYKLHFLFNCMASPSERAYATINDSPEAMTFSWELTTTPEKMTYDGKEYNNVAYMCIDTTKLSTQEEKEALNAFEASLYGTDGESGKPSKCPTPAEVAALAYTAG